MSLSPNRQEKEERNFIGIKEQLLANLAKPKLHPYTFDSVECFIKRWSELERMDWALYIASVTKEGSDIPEDKFFYCRYVASALCDENGKLLFSLDELEKLAEFPSVEIQKCFLDTIHLQRVHNDDDEDVKKN